MPFPSWLAGQRITADALNEMMPLRADKTVTQAYSSATLTADSELFLVLPAAGTYRFEVHAFIGQNTDNAADAKVAFSFTSGNLNFGLLGPHNAGLTTGSSSAGEWIARTDAVSASTNIPIGLSSNSSLHAVVKGMFRANSAQTLATMFAQNVASAQLTNIIDGSYMTAWRVA